MAALDPNELINWYIVESINNMLSPVLKIQFQMKAGVAKDMFSSSSCTRLLLTTQAYGMGVDTPDIRRLVYAGAPVTLRGMVSGVLWSWWLHNITAGQAYSVAWLLITWQL